MKLRKFNVFLVIFALLIVVHLLQPYAEGYKNKCSKKRGSCKKRSHHSSNPHHRNHHKQHRRRNRADNDFFNDSNYMLKTEMVPPVCPKCPDVKIDETFHRKKCPPCPPCARCPEPSFTCKKVPNYSFSNMNTLPQPMLNDFSQF